MFPTEISTVSNIFFYSTPLYKQTEPELFKRIVSASQELLGTTSPLLNDTAKAFDWKAETNHTTDYLSHGTNCFHFKAD